MSEATTPVTPSTVRTGAGATYEKELSEAKSIAKEPSKAPALEPFSAPPAPTTAPFETQNKKDLLEKSRRQRQGRTDWGPTAGPVSYLGLATSPAVHLAAFQAPGAYDIAAYAAEVEQQLGKIPSFNVLEQGQMIPMTVDDVPFVAGQPQPPGCDRPPLLGLGGGQGQVIPFSRLGRLPSSNPAVTWVFIARRYRFRTNPNDPLFEDVAIIGHNKTTGATAFFQMLSEGQGHPEGIDATRVPSPMEPADQTPAGRMTAAEFWLPPSGTAGIGCYQCHDTDPWVHTPYVDQVKLTLPNGRTETMVPAGPDLSQDPLANPPYNFVGSHEFADWPNPMKTFKPLNNQCVKCHRIGQFNSSQNFTLWSTGRATPSGATGSYSHYSRSHWMPAKTRDVSGARFADDLDQPDWDMIYKSSVDQILSLHSNPNQPGANLTPVGAPPPHP